MILDKTVNVTVNSRFFKRILSFGYDVKIGDKIEIPVEHLLKNSHCKIKCSCDICGAIRCTTYQDYNSKIEYDGKYHCLKCSLDKRVEILREKYGVENVFQLDDVKNKLKKTNIEKYGVERPLKSSIIMNKIKQTNMERYGSENVFQNDNIKKKICQTNIEKYGVDYPMKILETKEKTKKTMLDRYGVEYAQQSEDIFSKSVKSSFFIKEYKNIKYQGKYEKDFIEHCSFLNILELLSKPNCVKYIFKNKNCFYHPDFFIERLNLIIEIKSSYWFDIHKERTLIKEKYTVDNGFNYILIVDKNYFEFDKYVNKLNFNQL